MKDEKRLVMEADKLWVWWKVGSTSAMLCLGGGGERPGGASSLGGESEVG